MNEKHPIRKSVRLEGYDYSQEGSYFITTVTKDRETLFGEIVDGEMKLNDWGVIVQEEWIRSASIRVEIKLDEFVVMPNHFHAIVHFFDDQKGQIDQTDFTSSKVGAYGHTPQQVNDHTSQWVDGNTPQRVNGTFRSPSRSLGAMVRGFKAAVTTRINTLRKTPGIPIWQRNYFDHIIGTDREYDNIAEYIFNNPENWESERENYL